MYAIINVTLQTSDFFSSFAACSEACVMYPVHPGHVVYVVDFANNKIEQL